MTDSSAFGTGGNLGRINNSANTYARFWNLTKYREFAAV